MTHGSTAKLGPSARAYFCFCRRLGRWLRSARYSKVRIVAHDGGCQIRKRRAFYAPVLVGMSGPLMRVLDTGVRVLPQREWHAREASLYRSLYGLSIGVAADGTLVLPCLAGQTLASVLEQESSAETTRRRAVALAAAALGAFHRRGFTHGDAMAENVLIDVETDVARWFDFETVHDPQRSLTWRRADDLRALLVTCLLRTVPEKHAETHELIIDTYDDRDVTRALAAAFSSVWQRAMTFHLAQAPLSLARFQELEQFLRRLRIPSDSPPGTIPVID